MDFEPNQQFIPDINNTFSDSNYYTTEEFISNFKNTVNSFSLLHINSRSLNKNFDSLQTLLYTIDNFPFSIIGVTETWLNFTSPEMFNLQNYEMIRLDREGKRGGGVAFYVHKHLQFKIRRDISLKESETLFIEIENSKGKNILVGLMYRPPNSNFDIYCEDLEICFNKLSRENKQLYLMGDFNIDLLSANNYRDRFLHLIYSNACYPHINKPTRINSNSSTLIDNIFSNIFDKDITTGLLYSEISDHLPIFLMCNNDISSKNLRKPITYRKETPQNIESFKGDLALEEWPDIYNQTNTNIAYENFNKKLQFYYEKKFPLVSAKKNNKHGKMPWITKAILRSLHTRNRLYKTYLNHPTVYNMNRYKKYRNKLTTIIRTSRKMHYAEKLNQVKSNMKSTWRIINDLIGKKQNPLPNDKFTMNENIINPQDTANTFNSYFINIGPNLSNNIGNQNKDFTTFLTKPTQFSMFLNPTNPNEIIKITKDLNTSKSYGHDRISTSLLKQIIHVIASPLTYIFNLSITTGECPNALKIAKVNPIFKKNDPHEISNYRPISILSSISKILEKIIYNRLNNFLNTHELLNLNQYGFRKHHSTDLALVQLYDKITNALAEKKHVIGIFMDLSKAFDTLNHNILLKKLHSYGIRGVALSWFRDYLTNRQQYVVHNDLTSDLMTIECGVPQGSILGPLLFLIYINDITNTTSLLSFILFADDTNIFCSHHDLNTLVNTLNQELPKVSTWFKCNKLSLNINKTNFIYFKHNHAINFPYNIVIDNISLERKSHTKFLGVLIDENLNWNEHLRHITLYF